MWHSARFYWLADLAMRNLPYSCLGPVALNLKHLCQVTRQGLQQRDAGTSRNSRQQELADLHGARFVRGIGVGPARGQLMSADGRPVSRPRKVYCVSIAALGAAA